MNAIRKGLIKIGLIKQINELTELENIPDNSEMYNLIEMWKSLYKGYYAEWHDVKYHTIDGHKTRTMDTINMAKTASNGMASLVFNELCEISIGDDDIQQLNLLMMYLLKINLARSFKTTWSIHLLWVE